MILRTTFSCKQNSNNFGVYGQILKIFGPKQVGICPRLSIKRFLSGSVDQERKYSKPRQTRIVHFSDFQNAAGESG